MHRRSTISGLYGLSCVVALFCSTAVFTGGTTRASAASAEVDFSRHVRIWDGFGVNYVETAQTVDYEGDPQEYGGFSRLSENERREVLELIFGADGLKPGIVKMFLDPWHEGTTEAGNDNDDPMKIDPDGFDHETTTKWMRCFVRNGLAITRDRGADLRIITTLYGPPPWMTKQKIMRGRDLDPAMKRELAEYMIAWVRYLRNEEKFPVEYLSLHNEGESSYRWLPDGTTEPGSGHDYNLWWPPAQVVDFLRFMRPMMDEMGLEDVGLTCGETTQWIRFHRDTYRRDNVQKFAEAIVNDPVALENLALITSHGFAWGDDYMKHLTPAGVEMIREKRPGLHAWTTSMSWYKMHADFVNFIRHQIYTVGVNAVIPWACIQTDAWKGGDPNPNTAFKVEGNDYRVLPGYYYYKQVCRAGQPGMAVAHVSSDDRDIGLIAFAAGDTDHPNALIVINKDGDDSEKVNLKIAGTKAKTFAAWRSGENENYRSLGDFELDESGAMHYKAPPNSVTTFYAK